MMVKSLGFGVGLHISNEILICIMGVKLRFTPEYCCKRQGNACVAAWYQIKQRKSTRYFKVILLLQLPLDNEGLISTIKSRECLWWHARMNLPQSPCIPPTLFLPLNQV